MQSSGFQKTKFWFKGLFSSSEIFYEIPTPEISKIQAEAIVESQEPTDHHFSYPW